MKVAALFPGQGSQAIGMGQALSEEFPEARETLEEAEAVTGVPLREIMWEGPEDRLVATQNAQLALFATSIAAYRVFQRISGSTPMLAAGHSLGEYSALVAAGVLDYATGLRLVKLRGELMAEAGRTAPGSMAAVLGIAPEHLDEALSSVEGTVVVANRNATGQLVLSGEVEAVLAAAEAAKKKGAKRVIPLKVSGAFHSPLMAQAQLPLTEALARAPWHDARFPVVCNVDARPHARAAEFPDLLSRQLESPVLWSASMRHMVAQGVEAFLEMGSKRVLCGLLKKWVGQVEIHATEAPEALREACRAIALHPQGKP